MTESQALEKHKDDCKRCSFKVCKMPDNCTECLQEIDIKAYEELLQYRKIGTVGEFQKSADVQKQVTEIVNRQLIAGKNNYKETYDCFYEIVKVVQDNY